MDIQYSLIRPEWLKIIAQILTIGAKKYKTNDFSEKTEKEYFDSAAGHIIADREGIRIDPDDNQPSIVKAATCLLIIYTKRLNNQ